MLYTLSTSENNVSKYSFKGLTHKGICRFVETHYNYQCHILCHSLSFCLMINLLRGQRRLWTSGQKHKAFPSPDKNSLGMFLCVVGGTMSNQMLKGVDWWERWRDVYTGRKELGGVNSDRRVSEQCPIEPLPSLSEPVGGEHLFYPPSHYCQRQKRWSNKWLHWIGGVNEVWETYFLNTKCTFMSWCFTIVPW